MEEVRKLHEDKKVWISGFLTPYRRQMTEEVFWHHPGIRYSAYGGYPEARRVRVKAWPAGGNDAELPPVVLLSLTGDFSPDDKFEYELLQSLYAAGAEEDMIGDFLRDEEEQGAGVFVTEEISSTLITRLNRVGSEKVKVERLTEFQPLLINSFDRPGFKIIKGTVASMRLDAVISLALGISRARAVNTIKEGLVQVNWKIESSPSSQLKEKDMIMIGRRGTFIIESLPGKSRKGRCYIILKKFYS